MATASMFDVLTVPGYRKGPGVLGLVVIGLLFLVPGVMAPLGILQLVGVLWLAAAALSAVRDIRHIRASSAS